MGNGGSGGSERLFKFLLSAFVLEVVVVGHVGHPPGQ